MRISGQLRELRRLDELLRLVRPLHLWAVEVAAVRVRVQLRLERLCHGREQRRVRREQELRRRGNKRLAFRCVATSEYSATCGPAKGKRKGGAPLRFMVSRIITSVSQVPTPGPPRRERVGSTRFCLVFIPSFELEACAEGGGCGCRGVAGGAGAAGDDEEAVACWRLAARDPRVLTTPPRAPTMACEC